jgi:hypothetical protein
LIFFFSIVAVKNVSLRRTPNPGGVLWFTGRRAQHVVVALLVVVLAVVGVVVVNELLVNIIIMIGLD